VGGGKWQGWHGLDTARMEHKGHIRQQTSTGQQTTQNKQGSKQRGEKRERAGEATDPIIRSIRSNNRQESTWHIESNMTKNKSTWPFNTITIHDNEISHSLQVL